MQRHNVIVWHRCNFFCAPLLQWMGFVACVVSGFSRRCNRGGKCRGPYAFPSHVLPEVGCCTICSGGQIPVAATSNPKTSTTWSICFHQDLPMERCSKLSSEQGVEEGGATFMVSSRPLALSTGKQILWCRLSGAEFIIRK